MFCGYCLSLLVASVPVCQNICTNIFCCSLWSQLCRFLHLHLLCRIVEIGWNKAFWVRLCSWVGVYVLVHYPRHLDCQNPKATVVFNQLDVLKTSQNHNVLEVQGGFLIFWVAKISKTLTFEVPKFSPLRSFGFCLWLGLGPRLLRQHTAALRKWWQRFRGRAAPRGEGGRGCTEQSRPWPRRRIWWGNLTGHVLMKILVWQYFGATIAFQNWPHISSTV